MVEMVKGYIRGALSVNYPKQNIEWLDGYKSALRDLQRYISETETTINAKNDPQK